MKITPKPKPTDKATAPIAPGEVASALPSERGKKRRESMVLTLGKLLLFLFSHKGQFTLGIALFLLFLWLNFSFYLSLVSTLFGLAGFSQWVIAAFFSATTTSFECAHLVRKHKQGILHQIFLAAGKPSLLPTIDKNVAAHGDNLLRLYKMLEAQRMKTASYYRWGAIAFEVLIGVIHLGSIGAGVKGLVKLGTFVASIIGCEWGLGISLDALDSELPAVHAQQLEELTTNPQKLVLRKGASNE